MLLTKHESVLRTYWTALVTIYVIFYMYKTIHYIPYACIKFIKKGLFVLSNRIACNNMLTFFFKATQERVTDKARRTSADCIVIDDLTTSGTAARAGAGVDTVLADTGLVLRAISTDHTLWPAVGSTTVVPGLAGADGIVIHRSTHAVRPTRSGDAGICSHRWYWQHTTMLMLHAPLSGSQEKET